MFDGPASPRPMTSVAVGQQGDRGAAAAVDAEDQIVGHTAIGRPAEHAQHLADPAAMLGRAWLRASSGDTFA